MPLASPKLGPAAVKTLDGTATRRLNDVLTGAVSPDGRYCGGDLEVVILIGEVAKSLHASGRRLLLMHALGHYASHPAQRCMRPAASQAAVRQASIHQQRVSSLPA